MVHCELRACRLGRSTVSRRPAKSNQQKATETQLIQIFKTRHYACPRATQAFWRRLIRRNSQEFRLDLLAAQMAMMTFSSKFNDVDDMSETFSSAFDQMHQSPSGNAVLDSLVKAGTNAANPLTVLRSMRLWPSRLRSSSLSLRRPRTLSRPQGSISSKRLSWRA